MPVSALNTLESCDGLKCANAAMSLIEMSFVRFSLTKAIMPLSSVSLLLLFKNATLTEPKRAERLDKTAFLGVMICASFSVFSKKKIGDKTWNII